MVRVFGCFFLPRKDQMSPDAFLTRFQTPKTKVNTAFIHDLSQRLLNEL